MNDMPSFMYMYVIPSLICCMPMALQSFFLLSKVTTPGDWGKYVTIRSKNERKNLSCIIVSNHRYPTCKTHSFALEFKITTFNDT